MPLTVTPDRHAYSLTFGLPTGVFYTVEVTALQALQAGVNREDLERWWEVISAELPRLRVDNESYGEAIDRCLASWLASGLRMDEIEARLTNAEADMRERLLAEVFGHTAVPAVEPPNEGVAPAVEPTHYLGMPVNRTPNVRPNAVTIQATLGTRRTIFIHPTTPVEVWQVEARRQLARLVQRSAPVSIKQTCRYCGKAYPAKQGITDPDAYCSDRCRTAAADLIDCPVCAGSGASSVDGAKCGECYGSTYKPCDACQEDTARASLMFTNPSTGTVYYVCPSCVQEERDAGGIQAPQTSV